MSEYIAANTAASNGDDFTVSTSVGVSCYGMIGSEVVGKVEIKNSDDTYKTLTSRINPNQTPVDVILSGNHLEDFTIVKPGTYRIIKLETKGTVGIDIEGA